MSGVKGRREYDASGRQEQARQTRRAIVLSARDLLEQQGYTATTIAAVAKRAGVSAESIYKHYRTKAALAKAVFDFVIAGDDEPVAVADRPQADAVRAEPDVQNKVALYVLQAAVRQERSARIQLAIRDARQSDDALVELWQTLLDERLIGMTMFGRHLLESGQLRPGIELDEVRDVLWTYIGVEFYDLLVMERGWSRARYADWLARALIAALT